MPLLDNFEELVEQHHAIIYKICRVYSTADDFDDLYQEVLINLWKSRSSFKGLSKVSTWLYRVALNTALTYKRQVKKHSNKVSLNSIPEIPEPPNNNPDKVLRIDQLYDAIRQLRKDNRSIILLYLDEKTYEEIAEITGLSLSNVGVKINRIKKKLFQLLKEANHGR